MTLLFNFRLYKLFGRFFAIYPIHKNAPKLEIFMNQCIWYFHFINQTVCIGSMIQFVFCSKSDLSTFFICGMEILIGFEVIIVLLYSKFQETKIQKLVKMFEDALSSPNKRKVELIQKHGLFYIMLYLIETNYVGCFFVLKSLIMLFLYFIVGGLEMFTFESSIVTRLIVIILIISGVQRLYVFSLFTENLKQLGLDIGLAVYSSQWYDQSRKNALAKSIVICRSQKPLIVSIPGILDSWGMRYLGRFLYLVFSYIMTLRAIIQL
ncbi:uncharacterized protein LOC106640470 [Copidosoma floridanum]|uniref:uncharacterized protein LOC106640470 n=1 Tax=Copidosoma floridanum TaxID=29053 RepID=UPI0006C9D9A7|nr:uncharacterized protein LOC106640470 [Copidosoma floridanum]